MRISEVIEELEAVREAEGDIEVFTETDGEYSDTLSITVEEEDGEKFATLQTEAIDLGSEESGNE